MAGVLAGFAGFWIFRPLVARIPFTGDPFFTGDLSLGWLAVTCVAVGVPIAAVLVGLWSLRRVRISPLGVTRHVTPKPPRAWRLLPTVAALAVLAAAPALPLPEGDGGLWFIIGAFAVIIVGLFYAGPWFTMMGARVLARIARSDSTLIAARRLGDRPGAAFRAIGGLVLAVFVGTVFIGVVGTAIGHGGGFQEMTLPKGTVTDSFDTQQSGPLAPADLGGKAVRARHASPPVIGSAELLARLRGLRGVRQVLPVYAVPRKAGAAPGDSVNQGLLSAADWDRFAVYGPVASRAGAAGVVQVPAFDLLNGDLHARTSWPAARWRAADLRSYPLKALLVTTDGREVSAERVRTALMAALPAYSPPTAAGDGGDSSMALIELMQRMVDVGIILSLVIAGCSLAVAVAGGLIERKRPFTLLRLAGMPLAHLRRVVVLEAAVPLVLVALVSAAAGFLAADLILRATPNGYGLAAPAMSYYVLMAGGLAAALAVVCATLPLLGRLTEAQTARTE